MEILKGIADLFTNRVSTIFVDPHDNSRIEMHLIRGEKVEWELHNCLEKVRGGDLGFQSMRDLDSAIDTLIKIRREQIQAK